MTDRDPLDDNQMFWVWWVSFMVGMGAVCLMAWLLPLPVR